MSDLPVQFGSSSRLPARVQRQLSREIARINAAGVVVAAQQCVKVEVIEEVASTALMATSRLGLLERALVHQAPHAADRLQFIAEAAALGMGNVVQQTARKVL